MTSPRRSIRRAAPPAGRRSRRLAARLTLATALALTGASAAAHPAAAHGGAVDVVVRLLPGTDPAALAARYGVAVRDRMAELPDTYLVGGEVDADVLAAQLALDPAVTLAATNGPMRSPEVNGTARFYGWAAQPAGAATAQYASTLLDLPTAHGVTRGAGVVVAVVDTGVPLSSPHPALAGVLLPGIDLVDGDAVPDDVRTGRIDPVTGATDPMAGHGSHVAGIVHLVAPAARILPVRALDSTGGATQWTVARGLLWAADHGATVVNASFGGRGSTELLKVVVEGLSARGVVVVGAAGNDGRERDNAPAAEPCAVSATASDAADVLAPFATTGDTVDLAAPGVDVTSVHPFSPTGYASWSGSSMAAPFVAGAAALVRSVAPDATTGAVRRVLVSTGRPVTITPEQADRIDGPTVRLDVAAAVRAAAGGVAPTASDERCAG